MQFGFNLLAMLAFTMLSSNVIRFFIRPAAAFTPSLSSLHNLRYSRVSSKITFSSKASLKDGRASFLFQRKSPSLSSSLSSKTKLRMTGASEEELEQYKNKNNIDDQILSMISGNGEIKVTASTIRNLVNDVMIQQSLTATPADILARSMACGLLLSNGMQDEQTFQLTLNCDGPARSVVSIAQSNGEVRGYVANPGLGDMHITEAVGKGTVQIVKNHPEWPNPYSGITAIQHGDVDRDVGIYLAESEQRSCALAVSSKINGILCVAAGGYVVEQLPGCTAETIAQVEKNLGKIIEMNGSDPVPSGMLVDGLTPLDICSTILEDLDMKPLQQVNPKLVCDCTEERLFRAVRLLPRNDVDQILKEREEIEARCQFCGKVYRMVSDEVAERLATATGDPSLDADFKGE
mmetsp:Transcript_9210/g.11612  ORF Transcript_9210/g.11612 Transcript_9210/m.11612 type:complete len:406 (+) Transcript_9210:176-1393(+)